VRADLVSPGTHEQIVHFAPHFPASSSHDHHAACCRVGCETTFPAFAPIVGLSPDRRAVLFIPPCGGYFVRALVRADLVSPGTHEQIVHFAPHFPAATIRRRSASYGGTGRAAKHPAFFEKGHSEAAMTAWPWRLKVSSGIWISTESSGNTSLRTRLASLMISEPPSPLETRPRSSKLERS